MVGTVESTGIPSAEELGLTPSVEKSTESANKKKFRVEPGSNGFNELGLAAEVDMPRLNDAVEGKYDVFYS